MTSKQLQTNEFRQTMQDFITWLDTLSYTQATITTRARNTRDLLLHLEKHDIKNLRLITGHVLHHFISCQQKRKNQINGAGLTKATLNTIIAGVNLFTHYLQITGKTGYTDKLPYLSNHQSSRTILTMEEIQSLYNATYQVKSKSPDPLAYGQRDRAMLSVFYGCGLRKSEGVSLNKEDILQERNLLHVRKGKGKKERYVPVTKNNMAFIRDYMAYGRKYLQSRSTGHEKAFFISIYGNRCGDQALSGRLKMLVKQSHKASISKKSPTLHTLRHSIATHLLQQGMEIEMIKKFLGHHSIESTQIYTHVANEL